MLGYGKFGLVAEDLVEDVGCVSDRGRDDLGAVLGELVARPRVESDPSPVTEVTGQGLGVPGLDVHREALAGMTWSLLGG